MTFMPNSPEARDIASYIHPQTNARVHAETGPTIIAKGDGIWVEDSEGKRALDAGTSAGCAYGPVCSRLANASVLRTSDVMLKWILPPAPARSRVIVICRSISFVGQRVAPTFVTL